MFQKPLILAGAVLSTLKGVSATNIGTHNNFCFDASVSSNNLYNGAAFHQWQCASSWNQQWDIGNWQLSIQGTNKCVDVKDGDGYHTQIWDCTGGQNQRFSYREDGMFEWGNSGRCLTVPDYNYNNGVPFVLDECSKHADNMIFSYGGAIGYSAAMQNLGGSAGQPQQQQQQSSPKPTKNNGGGGGSSAVSPFALFPNGNKRILGWAVNDQFMPNIASGSKLSAYFHWQDGPVANAGKLFFIPQLWGNRNAYGIDYWAKWQQRLAEIGNSVPKMVFGMNECDISAQCNMNPQDAANLYRQEIHNRFAGRGSVLVSPAPAWDYENPNGWLGQFMNACSDCQIDAIAIHAYIELNNNVDGAVNELKKRVDAVSRNWGKPIIISELGLRQSGGGNAWDAERFMRACAAYLDNNNNVAAWSFFGGWAVPPDGYVNQHENMFNLDGSLTSLGGNFAWGPN